MLSNPLPWYVAGPLIGLMVPALLLLGNKSFGISSNLRHLCAALAPCGIDFFGHDWRGHIWNLAFLSGVFGGAVLAWHLAPSSHVAISSDTVAALNALGIHDLSGLVPGEVFGWATLFTPRGLTFLVIGGFLVGFGTAYGGGCTSGHAIAGLADFQLASLVAVCGFFVGGLFGTFVILPLVLGGL